MTEAVGWAAWAFLMVGTPIFMLGVGFAVFQDIREVNRKMREND